MKTVITHFYNEEYLLPFWLNHHKKYFDNGILIDYDSTDRSVNIIKEICPNWTVIKSRNRKFNALEVDGEINEIEDNHNLKGWRIALNVTEFLLGNYKSLDLIGDNDFQNILVPAYVMVDTKENEFKEINPNVSIFEQRYHGINPRTDDSLFRIRRSRKLTNFYSPHPIGRHHDTYNTDEFGVFWYGLSPLNESQIKRRLQIQHRISHSDIAKGFGIHHIINREQIIKQMEDSRPYSVDLSGEIIRYLSF
jgi:hypothetical protein